MPGFYVIEHGCLGGCKNKCTRAVSWWVECSEGFLSGGKKKRLKYNQQIRFLPAL